MWDLHLAESERNVMSWVPACTRAYLRRWREEAGIGEADLYFQGEKYNNGKKKLCFFWENTSTDFVNACWHAWGFFVSVVRAADNKGVRSPCFMIKGLRSLAAVCPQKREKNTTRRWLKKEKKVFYLLQPANSIFCYFPQIRLIRKVL